MYCVSSLKTSYYSLLTTHTSAIQAIEGKKIISQFEMSKEFASSFEVPRRERKKPQSLTHSNHLWLCMSDHWKSNHNFSSAHLFAVLEITPVFGLRHFREKRACRKSGRGSGQGRRDTVAPSPLKRHTGLNYVLVAERCLESCDRQWQSQSCKNSQRNK
jgi:hypothetical protein